MESEWSLATYVQLITQLPRTRTIRCRPSLFLYDFIFVLLSMFETLDLQTSLVTVTRPLCRMILLSDYYMVTLGQVSSIAY